MKAEPGCCPAHQYLSMLNLIINHYFAGHSQVQIITLQFPRRNQTKPIPFRAVSSNFGKTNLLSKHYRRRK
jgi:hypothetical protein